MSQITIQRVTALPDPLPEKTLFLVRDSERHVNAFLNISNASKPTVAIRRVNLSGPKELYRSVAGGNTSTATYQIINYDSFSSYIVSVSDGSVSQANEFITVTAPTTLGSIYLTVNSESSKINIVENVIYQTSIDYPATNGLDFTSELTIQLQALSVSNGPQTVTQTQVQVALDANFASGTIYSFNQTGEVHSVLISGLPAANGYHLRTRYVCTVLGNGPWSPVVSFNILAVLLPDQELVKFEQGTGNSSDSFGRSVSISGDGSTIAIGIPLRDPGGQTDKGEVQIYGKNGSGGWWVEDLLDEPAGALGDNFGYSVSLSNDGSRLVAGSPRDNDPTYGGSVGSISVYKRVAGVWSRIVKLIPTDRTAGDWFGYSVAISGDGSTIIASSPKDDNGALVDTGCAYIFIWNGTTYVQQAKLLASDKLDYDWFGSSVAISSNGNTAVIGAMYDDLTSPITTDTGAAYVFTRSGSVWTQQTKLLASDKANTDKFGHSIAISDDGLTIAIGCYDKAGAIGAVYIYVYSGGSWTEQTKLTPTSSGQVSAFGWSVSLSAGGSVVAVGAVNETVTGSNYAGYTYVFTRNGSTWTLFSKLSASDKAASAYFGSSVSITNDGNYVAVGATGHYNVLGYNSGGAYLFG